MKRNNVGGRIETTFASLSSGKTTAGATLGARRKALVAYLCVGDPTLEESIDLAVALADAGADMLELGVPFSDPTADGAAIARASQRAIARGGGLAATIKAAKAIRARTAVPLILFGYFNPIYVYGEKRVVSDAADAGVDGLLIVDLPPEEGRELRDEAARRGVSIIPLLAPTSSAARVEAIRQHALSFVYYVSVTGVTGAAAAPLVEASAQAGAIARTVKAPVIVGFGIDSPEKARAAASHADGIAVGTAIVRAIEDGPSADARRTAVVDIVRALRAGLDGAEAQPDSLPHPLADTQRAP